MSRVHDQNPNKVRSGPLSQDPWKYIPASHVESVPTSGDMIEWLELPKRGNT